MSKKPVVLMVLDGYGLSDKIEGNAVALAKTPVMDKLMATAPFVQGAASGLPVGLPDGQMGNSEVGHMNIGAGRIIYQELTRITKAIADGDFFENEEMLAAIENCKKNNSDLHLWGLLSDGGVHSHNTHLYAILELCKKQNFENVYVHPFFDGRDTPPASGKGYLEELIAKMKEIGVGKVASMSGRYYAMDRDNRWDRVELAYKSLVTGEGVQAEDAVAAMQESYDKKYMMSSFFQQSSQRTVSLYHLLSQMIQLYSSTSDQTEHVRLPEHSAVTISMDLREQMAVCHSHMYASRTMTSQYLTSLLHSRKKRSTTHLASILQLRDLSSSDLLRQRSMLM